MNISRLLEVLNEYLTSVINAIMSYRDQKIITTGPNISRLLEVLNEYLTSINAMASYRDQKIIAAGHEYERMRKRHSRRLSTSDEQREQMEILSARVRARHGCERSIEFLIERDAVRVANLINDLDIDSKKIALEQCIESLLAALNHLNTLSLSEADTMALSLLDTQAAMLIETLAEQYAKKEEYATENSKPGQAKAFFWLHDGYLNLKDICNLERGLTNMIEPVVPIELVELVDTPEPTASPIVDPVPVCKTPRYPAERTSFFSKPCPLNEESQIILDVDAPDSPKPNRF